MFNFYPELWVWLSPWVFIPWKLFTFLWSCWSSWSHDFPWSIILIDYQSFLVLLIHRIVFFCLLPSASSCYRYYNWITIMKIVGKNFSESTFFHPGNWEKFPRSAVYRIFWILKVNFIHHNWYLIEFYHVFTGLSTSEFRKRWTLPVIWVSFKEEQEISIMVKMNDK